MDVLIIILSEPYGECFFVSLLTISKYMFVFVRRSMIGMTYRINTKCRHRMGREGPLRDEIIVPFGNFLEGWKRVSSRHIPSCRVKSQDRPWSRERLTGPMRECMYSFSREDRPFPSCQNMCSPLPVKVPCRCYCCLISAVGYPSN